MKTKVQTWGNSLALRIPKPFATEMGLTKDTPVELSLEQGKLVILPASEHSPTLEELLQGITPENIHREFVAGGPVGNEVW